MNGQSPNSYYRTKVLSHVINATFTNAINTHKHGSSPIHLRPKCLFKDINDFEEIVDLPYSNIEKIRVSLTIEMELTH